MTKYAIATLALAAGVAAATGPGDVNGLKDAPRLFNDFGGSQLAFSTNYAGGVGSGSLRETNYGAGIFANRHAAWYADGNQGTPVDFDYGDGFDSCVTMTVNEATDVGNVEAGMQADLFGFGLFGVLTANGEVAAFGSTLPFHSFGTGIYNVGDTIMLRMIYRPGAGENMMPASTIEYRYNNLTTASGWVSSGLKPYGNLEGGIPSSFTQLFGFGAQINSPNATTGSVSIDWSKATIIPAPAGLALLGASGLFAGRRRR